MRPLKIYDINNKYVAIYPEGRGDSWSCILEDPITHILQYYDDNYLSKPAIVSEALLDEINVRWAKLVKECIDGKHEDCLIWEDNHE